MGGKDGNGLKVEKISQFFQVLMLCLKKNRTKYYGFNFALPAKFLTFDIPFEILQEHFAYSKRS